MVAVEAQQGRQVQPGQVVPRVPGDHRHHAAAAHGGGHVAGHIAGHGAGDVSDVAVDVSDVVLLVVITGSVSNRGHGACYLCPPRHSTAGSRWRAIC